MIILGCLKKLNICGAEPLGSGKARDITTGKELRKNLFDMYSAFANERLKVNHDMRLKKKIKIRRVVSAIKEDRQRLGL